MLIFIGWIAWSIVNGMIASANRRDVGGVVFASLFLSPLLVWLYLMAVGKNDVPSVAQSGPTVQSVLPPEPVTQPSIAPPKTLPEVNRRNRPVSSEYVLESSAKKQRSVWATKIPIFTVGTLCVVVIVALVQSPLGSSQKKRVYAPVPTPAHIETGHTAWISGIDSCEGSKEYGQLVAPSVNFYTSFDVDLSQVFGTIPHGTKIEAISFLDGMQRIYYDGHYGYVQDMFVVNYDPTTGVRPSKTGCLTP